MFKMIKLLAIWYDYTLSSSKQIAESFEHLQQHIDAGAMRLKQNLYKLLQLNI